MGPSSRNCSTIWLLYKQLPDSHNNSNRTCRNNLKSFSGYRNHHLSNGKILPARSTRFHFVFVEIYQGTRSEDPGVGRKDIHLNRVFVTQPHAAAYASFLFGLSPRYLFCVTDWTEHSASEFLQLLESAIRSQFISALINRPCSPGWSCQETSGIVSSS